MCTKTVISHLGRLLKPLGFSRQKATWNRKAESIVEVIDVHAMDRGSAGISGIPRRLRRLRARQGGTLD
jgi:hypothetical protein